MFRDAAALLSGQSLPEHGEAEVRAFVEKMGFGAALASGGEPAGVVPVAAYFEAAARMSRIFELGSPDAPGLACIGGTADPAAYGLSGYPVSNVSGRGLVLHTAFKSCVGEGVEYLSQLEWGDETLSADETIATAERDMRSRQFSDRLVDGARRGPWMPARSLTTGQSAMLPADVCIRRADRGATPRGFGAGCAAGESLEDATRSALLELVERDAVALWWIGGRRGAAIADETLAGTVMELLEGLRRGAVPGRATWLLDITTDLAIPCVAAMSADESGTGLVCGFCARPRLESAAIGAIIELCQMEMARRLVLVKLEHGGEAALAEMDRRHLRRMTGIDVQQCALLFPAHPPLVHDIVMPEELVPRLARHGIECLVVDLTRKALAVPVVRVLAPGLQGWPAHSATERLERVMQVTGGAQHYTGGIEIL